MRIVIKCTLDACRLLLSKIFPIVNFVSITYSIRYTISISNSLRNVNDGIQ